MKLRKRIRWCGQFSHNLLTNRCRRSHHKRRCACQSLRRSRRTSRLSERALSFFLLIGVSFLSASLSFIVIRFALGPINHASRGRSRFVGIPILPSVCVPRCPIRKLADAPKQQVRQPDYHDKHERHSMPNTPDNQSLE